MTVQCLGGWCKQREKCAHYHAEQTPGRHPVERLCEQGKDEPETARREEKQ